MGKGSSAPEKQLKSQITIKPRELGDAAGAQVAGGAGGTKPSGNACLISANETLRFKNSEDIGPGKEFFIVRETDENLAIFTGADRQGAYSGKFAKLIKKCIGDGYQYRGKVVKSQLNGSILLADCLIEGFKP